MQTFHKQNHVTLESICNDEVKRKLCVQPILTSTQGHREFHGLVQVYKLLSVFTTSQNRRGYRPQTIHQPFSLATSSFFFFVFSPDIVFKVINLIIFVAIVKQHKKVEVWWHFHNLLPDWWLCFFHRWNLKNCFKKIQPFVKKLIINFSYTNTHL